VWQVKGSTSMSTSPGAGAPSTSNKWTEKGPTHWTLKGESLPKINQLLSFIFRNIKTINYNKIVLKINKYLLLKFLFRFKVLCKVWAWFLVDHAFIDSLN
jgi:hypothetical protein